MQHRNYLHYIPFLLSITVGCLALASQNRSQQPSTFSPDSITYFDPNRNFFILGNDTIYLDFTFEDEPESVELTERDYEEFAAQFGVEVPAIKAVVEIETGKQHIGFWAEGKPIINYDLTVFRQMARKNKIDLSRYATSHAAAFGRPNISRYGSYQAAEQALLDCAMSIDSLSAIEGTFWGMFQIGGFNWHLCGCSSAQDFVKKMSTSERAQLELFGEFLSHTGLLKYLQAKNWSKFARWYNGPSYASRGYHTRLARAYAKFKGES